MKNTFFPALIAAEAVFVMACGDEDPNHGLFDEGSGNDNGAIEDTAGFDNAALDTDQPVSACLPAWGAQGAATVQPDTAQTFMTVETTAMNQLEVFDSPLPDRRTGWLAVGMGDCDKAGFLYRDPDLNDIKLVKLRYQDVTNVGSPSAQPAPELVVDGLTPSAHNASLFYGASCMAIAMQPGNDPYTEFRRSEAGIWSGKTIKVVESGMVTGLNGRGRMAGSGRHDGGHRHGQCGRDCKGHSRTPSDQGLQRMGILQLPPARRVHRTACAAPGPRRHRPCSVYQNPVPV